VVTAERGYRKAKGGEEYCSESTLAVSHRVTACQCARYPDNHPPRGDNNPQQVNVTNAPCTNHKVKFGLTKYTAKLTCAKRKFHAVERRRQPVTLRGRDRGVSVPGARKGQGPGSPALARVKNVLR